MTKNQCYCYAAVAIYNLKKSDSIISKDSFFYEVCDLLDTYSKDEIEKLYVKLKIDSN